MNGDMNKMHTKIELRGKMYPRQMELQGKTLALQLHFPGYILPRNSIYVVHFTTQLVFLLFAVCLSLPEACPKM